MSIGPNGASTGKIIIVLAVVLAAAYVLSTGGRQAGAATPDYTELRKEIQEFVRGRPQEIGIYFKDLTSGEEWGIDAERPVPAASTVKLPIALYVNRLVADGRLSWSERIRYERDRDLAQGAGVLQYDGIDGQTYSLRVLANLLITTSDNVAWRMLTRFLGKDSIAAYMRKMGGKTVYPGGENISTPRDMGAYVQALLDFRRERADLGERLVDDLSYTIWHVGLPGELPASVQVAHKEGDITGVADDVGVVFSRRPYILAIMSQGVDEIEAGFRDIARISRMIFDFQERLVATRPSP